MKNENETSLERVAFRLKWLREHHKLTQRQFARSIGVLPTQYNNWETARQRLSLDGALKVNAAYGTSLDFLFLARAETLPAHLLSSWASTPREADSK